MSIAITRPVSAGMINCELTHLDRQVINIEKARQQHKAYEHCLAAHGYSVVSLPESDDLPDSVFVEDTALVLDEVAVITLPGAVSRRPELEAVADCLVNYRRIIRIQNPGTLDGGDILRIGRYVYVGRSQRTNQNGIDQLRIFLAPYGYAVIAVDVHGCLHLKSAVTQVADQTLLVNRSWFDWSVFRPYELLDVHPAEAFGANALRLKDGAILYPEAYPETGRMLVEKGLEIELVDVAELAKAEGGVTCCSLFIEDV